MTGDALFVIGPAVILIVVLALPAARATVRRRDARRIERYEDRVRYFEDRIRADAERLAVERGITVDEALAYYRAGMRDLLRTYARRGR